MQDTTLSAADPFHLAMASFREGDRTHAAALCRDTLEAMPAHDKAGHLLGVIHYLEGDAHAAEACIRASLAVSADEEKETDLSLTLVAQARHAEAEDALRRALSINPDFATAHYKLAVLLDRAGKFEAAEGAYFRAFECNPDSAIYCFEFGKLLAKRGKPFEAQALLERAVELKPFWPEALNSLGIVLAQSKLAGQAEEVFRRAVESNPDFVIGLISLGNLLVDTKRFDEAERCLKRALELSPDDAQAGYNLAVLLSKTNRLDEAESLARRTIGRNPHSSMDYFGLANILLSKASGDIREALNCFRRAIEIDPGNQSAHGNLAYALTLAGAHGYEVLEECRRYAARFEAPYSSIPVAYENAFDVERKLRIGYVSPDFRKHCQAIFMLPLLRHHDHEQVEIYCYSSVEHPDDVTHQHAQFADHWRDIYKLDDDHLARQIKADRIDVLVDLTMHMTNARRLAFARRPAPVQIAWLAYPGTTGSDAIGYRLTDPYLDPIETRHLDDRYSEQSIRLADTFWCYEPLVSDCEVGPLPYETNGFITFGCLNNPCKFTDHVIALWAKVMRETAYSRLLLMLAEGEARVRVGEKFAALGIEADRITFIGFQPTEQYMRTYNDIDIALDTHPCNGHTTSLDALWMGVPIVTLVGDTPVSRGGFSFLSNLDLTELAAKTEEDFVRIAIELAKNAAELKRLRIGLRQRMLRSPLTDGVKFAKSMERAFREAWRDYCAQT